MPVKHVRIGKLCRASENLIGMEFPVLPFQLLDLPIMIRASLFSCLVACGAVAIGVAHASPPNLTTQATENVGLETATAQATSPAAPTDSQPVSVAYFCIGQTCTIKC